MAPLQLSSVLLELSRHGRTKRMVHPILRRPIVIILTSLLFLICLFTLFLPTARPSLSHVSNPFPSRRVTPSSAPSFSYNGYYGPHSTKPSHGTRRRIHYLLPATATNADACKLIFTGLALSYPLPILIGWGGHGRWNGSSNHLFKFPLFDEYFATLGPENDDDLIFLFDAYDIWLQLPPEVMIKRYLTAIEKENKRLDERGILDKTAVGAGGAKIRNTILFGADRLCWPQDPEGQIPCWSSPESLLPPTIFGPSTDRGNVAVAPAVRPRHLNSGTLIGTLKDVRDFWNSTYDIVEQLRPNSTWKMKNSDQHYLHILWNRQEEARLGLANGTMTADATKTRTEFGVTVDGEGDVYQESLYHEWVTWMRFNHSSNTNTPDMNPAGLHNRQHAELGRLDRLELQPDIAISPGPFAADALTTMLNPAGWADVMLGMNVLTGTVFPLFHITPLKYLRDIWWGRMWFHPYAEELLEAGRRKWLREMKKGNKWEHVVAEVDGVQYVAVDGAKGNFVELTKSRDAGNTKGGIWNDLGEWLEWEDICGEHEDEVFGRY